MAQKQYDVVVVGAGIAGLTAAKTVAAGGALTACIEEQMFGGLVINVNSLDPCPPGAPTSGVELASALMEEATGFGVDTPTAAVTRVARDGSLFRVTTDSGDFFSRAVIVASGAKLRRLGVPGETEFEDRGVAHCADCDGPMYRDQDVAVAGGGDSALQAALVLAQFCRKVHLVHRGPRFRASKAFEHAVATCVNIELHPRTLVEQIVGTDSVCGIRVREVDAEGTTELPCAALFPYVGLMPNTAFMPAEADLDEDGRIITNSSLHTTIPGLLAAGAVRAGCGGLITDAIDDGQLAASGALVWIARV